MKIMKFVIFTILLVTTQLSAKDSKIFVGLGAGYGVGIDSLINTTGTRSQNYTLIPIPLQIGYTKDDMSYYTSIVYNYTGVTYLNYGLGARYDVSSISFFNIMPTISLEQQLTTISTSKLNMIGWGSSIITGAIYKSSFNLDILLGYKYDLVFWSYPVSGVMNTHNQHSFITNLNYNFNLSNSNITKETKGADNENK